jgi:pseudouridine synthase
MDIRCSFTTFAPTSLTMRRTCRLRPSVIVMSKRVLGDRGPSTRFDITITEGRNRQVRRMVKEVGAKVEKLQRISIGPLDLGDLASGKVRALTPAEVSALRSAAAKRAAS